MPAVLNKSKQEVTLYSLDRDSVIIRPNIMSLVDDKFMFNLPKTVEEVGAIPYFKNFTYKPLTGSALYGSQALHVLGFF